MITFNRVRVPLGLNTDIFSIDNLLVFQSNPYLEEIAVGVECMFYWYWLADLYAEHHIRLVLGFELYMKAIHGGKTKNDKIDSYKLASLLKADTAT